MRKLIDLPDGLITALKVEAAKSGTSFKGYLEDVIVKHYETGQTQLSIIAVNDGQVFRPFVDYIDKTFNGLKGKEFEFDGWVFEKRIDFYKHMLCVIGMMIDQYDENDEK